MNASQFKILLLIQVVTVFLVGMLFFKDSTTQVAKSLTSADAKAIKRANNIKVNYGDNYVYGNQEAKNELIVFTRYNCEYCRDFYNQVFDSLKVNHIYKSTLKVVFIDNVNPKDKMGMLMAKTAEIARQMNKYEAIQNIFYRNEQPLDSMAVIQVAIEAGVGRTDLEEKIDSEEIKMLIMNDNKEGDLLQLTGTPTFVVNGAVIPGFINYEKFKNLLKN
jgi:protein-disulfide isomerase